MRQRLKPLGLNKDYPAYDVPPDFYTDASNVKFLDGAAERVDGYAQSYGTLDHAPLYLVPVYLPLNFLIMYAGESVVSVSDGVQQFTITPAAGWTGSLSDRITGGSLNALPFLNNAKETPIYWDGNTSNIMLPLPGWPAVTYAKALRPYKNFLIAMNLQESGNDYPTKLLWSNSAEPGAVPAEWTAAADNDAGDAILASLPGGLVDGLALRDAFVIYKTQGCYLMQYVGGNDVMVFRELFANVGMLAPGCAVEVKGTHFVLTDGDLVRHDGNTAQSVINERMRDWLFSDIDGDNGEMTYLTHNATQSEIWICYPSSGSSVCDKALIYNYEADTYGIRALPDCPHITGGIIGSELLIDTWDEAGDFANETWTTIERIWNRKGYTPTADGLIMAGYTASELYDVAAADTADGATMAAYVTRESLDLGDPERLKLVRRVWPRITGTAGDTIELTVGYQMEAGDAITYGTPVSFTIGTDEHLSVFSKGRYLSFKWSDTSNNKWKLHGFDVEYKLLGRHS